jgi:hypothetical protein
MFRALFNLGSVAILVLLLHGCAGTPVRSNASAEDLQKKSVVILSVSHDIEAGDGAKAIFYLDESRYPGRVVMMSVQDVLSIPTANEFKDRRGHLYVLELEPGPHVIDGWQVASAGARIFPKEEPAPLKFEIRQGEALYLGNLHARLALGQRAFFGARAAHGAIPVVMDQQEQDIALAEARVPALKGNIKIAMLPLGPWLRTSETVQRFDPVPVPVIPRK